MGYYPPIALTLLYLTFQYFLRYIGSEHMEDFNQFEDLENIIESKINKDVNDKINNINEYMDKFVRISFILMDYFIYSLYF